MKNIFSLIILVFAVAITPATTAEEASPYLVLESTGQSLFKRIADNQQELNKFPDLMRQIVEEELMPTVDYKYAAYRILGKKLKKTTKAQREKFVESFRHYLVRTYATALKQYKNQQVLFEKDKSTKGKKIVSVNTQIIAPDKPTINIAFKMRRNKKTKSWKAYDMVVEGISLISSKQAEFARKISQHGLDQVTLELASISK